VVKLTLVDGHKGVDDVLVLVDAQAEPLAFSQLLFILKHYFDSEDSYYPQAKGNDGKAYLLKAIIDVYSGVPFEKILRRYNLENKLDIVDRRKKENAVPTQVRRIEKLHEVL